MLQTWLIPFGFTRLVKFELFGSKCFLKYYCRTFYNASFLLNELDLSPKTLFLHIFSLLVCVLFSSFVLLNLPLHGLPCSPFMQLLGSFKLPFSLSIFLVMELISFVWSIGDCLHWWLLISLFFLTSSFWELMPKSVMVGIPPIEVISLVQAISLSGVNEARPSSKA